MPKTKKKQPSKKAGAVAEQTEFKNIDGTWDKFLMTDLGKALDAYVKDKRLQEGIKEDLANDTDLVVIEMRKAGKDYIKPQIDGVFYEFAIEKIDAKLKFRRAKT